MCSLSRPLYKKLYDVRKSQLTSLLYHQIYVCRNFVCVTHEHSKETKELVEAVDSFEILYSLFKIFSVDLETRSLITQKMLFIDECRTPRDEHYPPPQSTLFNDYVHD